MSAKANYQSTGDYTTARRSSHDDSTTASCGDYAVTRASMESTKVFPMLKCQCYTDVINDTAKLVGPLVSNQHLQREFILVLKQPGKNLKKLSNELHAWQERLVSQSGERGSDTSFPELLGHLSTPSPHTLDQVKALTIATEAFRELPPISVEQILKLTTEEKRNLFRLFKVIPIVSSTHGFFEPALAKKDLLYEHLLTKIGFSDCRGHLMYEKQRGDSGLDKITLTIIAILSVTSIY